MDQNKQAIVIADLGFGDAGKGSLIDFLARRTSAHTVVRYNGGPQAGHNVVTPDGRHHTFSQFTSGMFLPGVQTLLSRFMLVNPLTMLKEGRHLQACGVSDAFQRVRIDRHALVITPFQRAMNRLREIERDANRHGSCGEGIGECMADALTYGDAVLRAGDLEDPALLLKKLRFLREAKYQEYVELRPRLPDSLAVQQEYAVLTDPGCMETCLEVYGYFASSVDMIDEAAIRALFSRPGTLLFEGAQGILLDEQYGFAPYTTWSTTTCANAETLLQENDYTGVITRLGVMRAYATRHGAGPFPTEDQALTALLPEPHNSWNPWQGEFRTGYCDVVAARYALEVAGKPEYLAVTHVDGLETLPAWRVCTAYRYQGAVQDLPAYFKHGGNRITEIQVVKPPNLPHQEHLTRLLTECTPEYRVLVPPSSGAITLEDRVAYCSFLAESLAVPLAITSHGPTAQEKRCWGIKNACNIRRWTV